MPFTIADAWLPATVTAPPMTDEEFAELASEHPDLCFETNASGELIVMPMPFSRTGFRNQEISLQLGIWARDDGRGRAGDSSTGFVLPNGARRSPDACWVLTERIRKLDTYSRKHYFRLCPDFVIELRSDTDRLGVLRDKMREWIGNGAQLGWLIDPERRAVEIFRPGINLEVLEEVTEVRGEAPVAGFVLNLIPVWELD